MKCLPVISEPTFDIDNGNGLCCAFAKSYGHAIHMFFVYWGEDSYSRRHPTSVNRVGSWLYRVNRYRVYKRTADVKDLKILGAPGSKWTSLFSSHFAGQHQTWAHGDKANFGGVYSLFYHYQRDIAYDNWNKHQNTERPVVYLNTLNHLFGTTPRHEGIPESRTLHIDYPVFAGGMEDAFRYARHLPYKIGCCVRHKRAPYAYVDPSMYPIMYHAAYVLGRRLGFVDASNFSI